VVALSWVVGSITVCLLQHLLHKMVATPNAGGSIAVALSRNFDLGSQHQLSAVVAPPKAPGSTTRRCSRHRHHPWQLPRPPSEEIQRKPNPRQRHPATPHRRTVAEEVWRATSLAAASQHNQLSLQHPTSPSSTDAPSMQQRLCRR
jgi:hypothetical protein